MATAPIQRRPQVEFEVNVPVEVALKYAGMGKIVAGQYGERVMYTLADGRVMFLDLGPAQRINELGINVGETFFVCKKLNNRKVEWRIWLTPETEKARAAAEMQRMTPEQRAQVPLTDALQASMDLRNVIPPAAGASTPATGSTAANRQPSGTSTATVPQRPGLVDEANSLVDAYHEVMRRALEQYQGQVKPEEVKAIVLSVYIQRGKLGGGHAA